MYDELLTTTCEIYRLNDWENYDFSASEEGEMEEEWELVESASCRVDGNDETVIRRSDGSVEVSTGTVFFSLSADVRRNDRIKVTLPYSGQQIYQVLRCGFIEGYDGYTHKEADVIHVDWETVS
jgi:hypothetical protein